ncbi:MAG: helix-turn-helix domain-containing protein [Streptosporangiales bacterium]|nr:helix-turn-helix domain-containing protein [Streptosporangiales bacterium]
MTWTYTISASVCWTSKLPCAIVDAIALPAQPVRDAQLRGRPEGGDPVAVSPTMRRRRLAAELRELRDQAGLSNEDVAEKLDWDSAKLSRIENRRAGITAKDLRRLLNLYGVTDGAQYDDLLEIARRASERSWYQVYGSDVVPSALANLIGFETEARTIRIYEPELVPGLLQTEAYARAVLRAWEPGRTAEEIERRVEVRLGRQDVLTRNDPPPPQVNVILNEGVLQRPVGGIDVMREQIKHLMKERDRANLVVQILPFSAREHPSMSGSFEMLTFFDEGDVGAVHVESLLVAHALEKPDQIRKYDEVWGALQAKAASPEDSRAMMRTYSLR